jgi:16S rRNA (cytidine1402-2'-O)-methyltransferase
VTFGDGEPGEPRRSAGVLILGGVPLGKAGDASARLVDALRDAAVIAAEDTRRLHRLAAELGVQLTGRLYSFYEQNSAARVPQLIDILRQGTDVLLVTDAGMPSVSDPGYELVVAALAENLSVSVLPGPSAVTTALVVSGLPVDRFCFEGFLPRKAGPRRSAVRSLAAEPRTMVFFESPRRVPDLLADLAELFGAQRPAAVCRELTKTHEEVRRGVLADLVAWARSAPVLGEITVVVAGAPATQIRIEPAALSTAVAELEAAGLNRKQAIAQVAERSRVAKRAVFDAVVAAKQARPVGAGERPGAAH